MLVAIDSSGLSDTLNLNVIVNPINDPPVFAAMPDTSTDEDVNLSIALNASDPDGDFLTFSVDPSEHVETFVFANGDSLLMVPNQDWNGESEITLYVNDGSGLFDQTSFVLTVNAINDDPIEQGYLDDVVLDEDFDLPWFVNLDDIFRDVDSDLVYEIDDLNPGVLNSDIINNNQLHLWAEENLYGVTDIIVTASNQLRTSISDTFNVIILPVNDPPEILSPNGTHFNYLEDEPISLPISITDVDNNNIEVILINDTHFIRSELQ